MKSYFCALCARSGYALIVAFFVFLTCIFASGQTLIAIQDFETVPAGTPWAISSGGANISIADGAGDTPTNQRIKGGSQSWQVNNSSATLDLANVTIPAMYGSTRVVVSVSGTSRVAGNGLDLGDFINVYAALNGGAFAGTPDISINGAGSSRWSYNATENASTIAGLPIARTASSGSNVSLIYSKLIVTIPNGTTSVALRVVATNDNGQENWNVDDIRLEGFAPSAANAIVSGRVMSANGYGVRNASVIVSGGSLEQPLRVVTGSFGYYRFDVPAGNSYVLSVVSKRYYFPESSRIINVDQDLVGIDFQAADESGQPVTESIEPCRNLRDVQCPGTKRK